MRSYKCDVKGCRMSDSVYLRSTKNKVSLHGFPKQSRLRKLWWDKLDEWNKGSTPNRKYHYVCSNHFESGLVVTNFGITKLVPNSVPSIQVPEEDENNNVEAEYLTTDFECDTYENYEYLEMESDQSVERDINVEKLHSIEANYVMGTQNLQNAVNSMSYTENSENTFTSCDAYSLSTLYNELQCVELFPALWGFMQVPFGISLSYYGDSFSHVTRSILIKPDMTIEVRAKDKLSTQIVFDAKVTCVDEVLRIIQIVNGFFLCRGSQNGFCIGTGFFSSAETPRTDLCQACRKVHKRQDDREKKIKKRSVMTKAKNDMKALFVRNLKRKCIRLRSNVSTCIKDLKQRCAEQSQSSVEIAIGALPKLQQEAIRACLKAAQCKGPTGIRYNNTWLLECLLLRIKSRRAYLHILNHHILQVPTLDTLSRHLKKLKPSFGFREEMFSMLKTKVAEMNPKDIRGTLVLDEMKVSEAIAFTSESLLFTGFVDLGKYTPQHQQDVRGDHALVFMFQPFRGPWVQTIAAFLSKGCAASSCLHQIILECIVLCENAGLRIDVVTTDGASWNRTMWTLFGLRGTDTSCVHPCACLNDDIEHKEETSPKRRLWFASDATHLWKNFRNFVVKDCETWTPDGVVKMAHLEALLKQDGGKKNFGLKIAHKLTADHINPKYYQKMNSGLVVQLFSEEVARALEVYQGSENPPKELTDCNATIDFVRRVHKVIVAMSSRTPRNALAFYTKSYKIIVDFLEYLEDWPDEASLKEYKFLSSNTYIGLQVTLKSTIEIMTFLTDEWEYRYLMTARLNQDALFLLLLEPGK